MSSRTQQLRQSFLLTGAVVALVLVTGFALLSSRSVTRIVEQQANERGQDVATHVASVVGLYLRERRREAEALAQSPAVVRAALDGSQQAISQRLLQLDTPTLERMFNQRRALGGDPDLAAYLRDYVQRSEFSELLLTERHGYAVLASNRTADFVQSDEEWWRRAAADGVYEGAPRYDSSAAAVALEYDVAIRAPRVAAPVGVLKAVFALDRLANLLTAADVGGGVRVQGVDAQGTLIVGGGGGDREPGGGRRSLSDRRDRADRHGGGGRPPVLGAHHGRGAAPPGRRDPHGGGRGGGDGHRDFGLHRGDERVDRGDVRHVPGSDQAGGGAGPAGARRGGRREQDPPDRDHPRRRRRGLGATQHRRRRCRPAQQGRVGSEHRAAREAGGRGEPRRHRGRSAGAGLVRHPEVRDAGQGGGHADEHARPERGDRGGARGAAGTRLCRGGGRGAEARLGGSARGGRHRRHGARRARPRAGDARSADAARPGHGRRAGRGADGGSGPRDGGRGGAGERRVGPGG